MSGITNSANDGWLERIFLFKQNGSTVRREVVAGITTFLTAMYIIVVNPAILSQGGVPFSGALTATVLVSFFGSCAMGLYARNPVLVAPGMGMNALFSFVMVHGGKMPWQTALGCVFWSGVIFAILAAFNARKFVVEAIPTNLRHALSCGIGIFIAVIGLVNARFLVSDQATVIHGAPLDIALCTFLAGLVITAVLVVRRVPGALMLGILLTTLLAFPIGRWWGDGSEYGPAATVQRTLVNWHGWFAMPDFSTIMKLDIVGALRFIYAPFIFVMLFTAFFDALSTFMAVANAGGLTDDHGNPRNISQSMKVDAFSALISAPLGTSPANAYIESAAGIAAGGRTGLTAVVSATCFLPFLFLSPLLSLIPSIATAPALVLVGVFMMESIREIDWGRLDEAIPAFVAMIVMPLTYSITSGIAYGSVVFVLLKIATNKADDVKPAMWIVAGVSVALLSQL
jgi:AGZA family xanthine/uracil permease-like MFS transporter